MDGEEVQGRLSEEEQQGLRAPKGGRQPINRLTPASCCFATESGRRRHKIARALKLGTATVERVRRRGVEEGLEAALGRATTHRRQRKLGTVQGRLT